MSEATRAEVCAAAIADAFAEDGEILASPMGLVPTLGVRLTKLTSNPDIAISDGESVFIGGTPPLGATADVVEGWLPYRRVFDVIAYGRRHVMMGATQIDRYGNQNISAIGDFRQPRRQLLGSRAAASNTVNNRTSYWIPRHSPRVFVEQVDVVSGVGPRRARAAGPGASTYNDVHRIVSDLGVFDVNGPQETLRLLSTHPGVSVEEVQAASGFEVYVDDDVATTREPTDVELVLIREVLDPNKLREREVPHA